MAIFLISAASCARKARKALRESFWAYTAGCAVNNSAKKNEVSLTKESVFIFIS